ncbi:hypothetical protein [Candidatus Methanomassiliicoccus intestinalis]|nr:hypothetical protein [Candidatus Methanomassiliicoccus intestinalis]
MMYTRLSRQYSKRNTLHYIDLRLGEPTDMLNKIIADCRMNAPCKSVDIH